MATALDWNLLSPLVQLAARPIGQSALRYEVRDASDDVRIYFASGWYADVAFDLVASLAPSKHAAIERLSVELRTQYEKHGMPIEKRCREMRTMLHDEIIERIKAFDDVGAKSTQMVVLVGVKARHDLFDGEHGKCLAPVPGWAYHKVLGPEGWLGQIANVGIYYDPDCPTWRVQWPIEKPAHTCPGCGSPCEPPINIWGANLYGCAKCCPSIGSYSSRIVIKYPDDAWRTDVDCTPLIDGLTKAECLQRYETDQRYELGGLVKPLTLRQLEVARAMWSAQLRAKVTESTEKERARVTIDTSMWDD